MVNLLNCTLKFCSGKAVRWSLLEAERVQKGCQQRDDTTYTEKWFPLSLGYPSLTRSLPEFISINECGSYYFRGVNFKKCTFRCHAFCVTDIKLQRITEEFSDILCEIEYIPACHVGLLLVISHHVLKVIWCEHTILHDKKREACAVHGESRVIRSHAVTNGGLCLVLISTLS